MERKYFIGDKNYLAHNAQDLARDALLFYWYECVIEGYTQLHNPLGLIDEFTRNLKDETPTLQILNESYDLIAAYYRMQYLDNQLSFVWDGTSHTIKYQDEWSEWFQKFALDISFTEPVNRIILRGTILCKEVNTEIVAKTLLRYVCQRLNIKKTRKGLIEAA